MVNHLLGVTALATCARIIAQVHIETVDKGVVVKPVRIGHHGHPCRSTRRQVVQFVWSEMFVRVLLCCSTEQR